MDSEHETFFIQRAFPEPEFELFQKDDKYWMVRFQSQTLVNFSLSNEYGQRFMYISQIGAIPPYRGPDILKKMYFLAAELQAEHIRLEDGSCIPFTKCNRKQSLAHDMYLSLSLETYNILIYGQSWYERFRYYLTGVDIAAVRAQRLAFIQQPLRQLESLERKVTLFDKNNHRKVMGVKPFKKIILLLEHHVALEAPVDVDIITIQQAMTWIDTFRKAHQLNPADEANCIFFESLAYICFALSSHLSPSKSMMELDMSDSNTKIFYESL